MRPLSDDGLDGRSPRINLRLPRDQHTRLAELARSAGVTVSGLARRAIERELELAGAERGPPGSGGR